MENRECPFCGKSKLKLDYRTSGGPKYCGSEAYNTVVGSIRCNSCHARGPTVSMLVKVGTYGFGDELKTRAFNIWNKRTAAEHVEV